MEHTDEYRDYLNSFAWKIQRVKALERADWRCEKCHKTRYQVTLQVHHLTYSDRKSENERQFYDTRLDGWATKVYGEEWQDRFDPELVEEKFDNWLERRT